MSKLLIAEITGHALTLAEVSRQGKQLAVTAPVSIALPRVFTPETLAEAQAQLKAAASAVGLRGGPATLILGRQRVNVRNLRLPECPAEDLPALVAFELEVPLESGPPGAAATGPIVDFQAGSPQQGERDLFAALLDRPLLGDLQQLLQAVGITAKQVLFRPYAAFYAWEHLHTQMGGQPVESQSVLLVQMASDGIEISVWVSGQLQMVRLLPDRPEAPLRFRAEQLAGEIRRTVAALRTQSPHLPLDDRGIVLCGRGQHPLADALEDQVGRLVQCIDPGDYLPESVPTGPASPETPGVHGPSAGTAMLGAFLHHEGKGVWPIDFLAPKRPPIKRDRRLSVGLLSAAVLVLAVLAGGSVVRNRFLEYDRQLALINKQTAKYQNDIAALQGLKQRHERIREWIDSEIHTQQEYNELRSTFPDTSKAYLTRLELLAGSGTTPGVLLLQGKAESPEVVTEMAKRWAQDPDSHYLVEPGVIDPEYESEKFPWRFGLRIQAKQLTAEQHQKRLADRLADVAKLEEPPAGMRREPLPISTGSSLATASRPSSSRTTTASTAPTPSSPPPAGSGAPATMPAPPSGTPPATASTTAASPSPSPSSAPPSGTTAAAPAADDGLDPVTRMVNRLRGLSFEEREAEIQKAPRFLQGRIRDKLKEPAP